MNIDTVEEMAKAGRKLEAIAALTELDAEEPRPNHKKRLVELRHEAFATLDKSPGRSTWPPEYADPFPGETDIPTIGREGISDAVIGGAVTHHGCLRVNGLLDRPFAEGLHSLIDDAFDGRARYLDDPDADVDLGTATFVPFIVGEERAKGFGSDVFVRVCDVPSAMGQLAEVFAATGLRDAIAAYLGERPVMIANKWILRRSPCGPEAVDYHQDGTFLGEGIRTIDCWIALSECGPGTSRPGIDLVPRRFSLLPTGEGSLMWWTSSPETVRAAMPDAAVASPTFNPGDALIFDERLPHRTQPGTELDRRYAIESWFVAPSSYPDRHEPIVL